MGWIDGLCVRWPIIISGKAGKHASFVPIRFVLAPLIRSNRMLPRPKFHFMAGKILIGFGSQEICHKFCTFLVRTPMLFTLQTFSFSPLDHF